MFGREVSFNYTRMWNQPSISNKLPGNNNPWFYYISFIKSRFLWCYRWDQSASSAHSGCCSSSFTCKHSLLADSFEVLTDSWLVSNFIKVIFYYIVLLALLLLLLVCPLHRRISWITIALTSTGAGFFLLWINFFCPCFLLILSQVVWIPTIVIRWL